MNSSDYREAAVALARLASLDAEIGQCKSTADDVEGSVGRLRGRLDDMGTGLARGLLQCPRCERFLLPASWDRHD
jgi:hypothetical protein